MANSLTITEVLKLPLEERLRLYGSQQIKSFSLDAETYTGYKGYSFFWELTYVNQPERSQGGVIDLSSSAYFITPHLRIDFSLISYHDFMRLRQQQLSKTYFTLTCWDTDFNRTITEEVYFHPDTLPNFQFMARKLNGEKWTEILGAKDYTIELVGTNRSVERKIIEYHLNKPSGASWSYGNTVSKTFSKNSTIGMGNDAFIQTGTDASGNAKYTKISAITFGDKYKFKYWASDKNGKSPTFLDGDEYFLNDNITVYAIWEQKQP